MKFVTPSDQQVIQLNKFELENLVDTLNYNDEELQVEKISSWVWIRTEKN